MRRRNNRRTNKNAKPVIIVIAVIVILAIIFAITKIIKVKEYDGDNEDEREFFNGLFKGTKEEVTRSDLYNCFYVTLNNIKKNINRTVTG